MFDITERRLAEEQLRETEERFRAIVEHVPAGIYVDAPDTSMKTMYASPQVEDITGIPPDEWAEDPDAWADALHPDDRERVLGRYLAAVATEEPWSDEYRMQTRDGRTIWVHDETTFIHDDEGRHAMLLGVISDITERKLAEHALRESEQREREAAERLRALDEMKNTFLAAVSHELRSPLTAILGLALTLERSEMVEDDRTDLLERLAANARKLDRLLKDLLDIDRLNRGIVDPQLRVTDVGALSRRTIESLDALADRSIMVFAEPVVISVDPAKVERIVENLLMNAARHTKPDRTIWLRVQPEGDGVLIVVEDDGLGVPEDLREAIFEPFRQGPGPRRRIRPVPASASRWSVGSRRYTAAGRGSRSAREAAPPSASTSPTVRPARRTAQRTPQAVRRPSDRRRQARLERPMPGQDHNPRKRRLYLPDRLHQWGPGTGAPASEGRKPPWLKVRLASGPNHAELTSIMRGLDLHTVCEEAMCPNIGECWESREATFLILGDRCTRRCGFCDVMTARPEPVDEDEPARIASAVQQMGLRFVVVTGVARDDLPDGGARHLGRHHPRGARRGSRLRGRGTADRLQGRRARHRHRDRRRTRRVRAQPGDGPAPARPDSPAFGYDRSLEVLRIAERLRAGKITKSNLILGMGEAPSEVTEALADLRDAGCDLRDDRSVPAADEAPPAGRSLGDARRVRRAQARRRDPGHPPRGGRTARPELVPRRHAVPAGERRAGRRPLDTGTISAGNRRGDGRGGVGL